MDGSEVMLARVGKFLLHVIRERLSDVLTGHSELMIDVRAALHPIVTRKSSSSSGSVDEATVSAKGSSTKTPRTIVPGGKSSGLTVAGITRQLRSSLEGI